MVNRINTPLVSIITPSFNQSSFLGETINSVINQNYKNIEYIIIDGGSTDNSIEIIKKYEKNLAYWVSEIDKGQSDAINKGFKKVSGDLICWVNSDDVLYPEFVSKRVDQFEKNNNISMIYGDVDQGWDIQNKVIRKGAQQTWSEMITTGIVKIPQMSAIWKKEIFNTLGGLDINLNVLLDWEYFIRIAEKYEILYYPGSVAFFRQHKDAKSVNLNVHWAEEMVRYYEKHVFNSHDKKDLNYPYIRQNIYFLCAAIHEESNEKTKARTYLKMAKEVSLIRFYFRYSLKRAIQLLVRIKKLLIDLI
jgi:glycosyltransferase involved in cell wall biosynthesis